MTNWGILGTGNIAKTFASAIKETDRSTLLAVGSRSKDSADLFASTYNCIGFDDYQKLLDDKDINSIYISMSCSICYTNKYLLETSCKHVFCYECLSKWFSQKINCPYCRKNLLFNLKFTDLT